MIQRVLKGYQFRLYPTKEQEDFFAKTFGSCRFVWNYILATKSEGYKFGGISLNYCDTSKGLKEIKGLEELKWLKEVNSQSIQQELRKLDVAYTRFFKKISNYPVFKTKRDKQSFIVPQHFEYKDGLIFIPKLKSGIKVNQHREFGQNHIIKFITISKSKVGNYYISFQVEEDKIVKDPKSNNQIGIDLGLDSLMTFSDGKKIKNPRIAKKYRKKIEYNHRQLSKKQKGSKNREKSRIQLAKSYEKINNIKKDYSHKLTSKIISENQVICLEDLSIVNMMKNPKLSRSIQEVSWGEIVRQLEYKANWNNRQIIKIERFYPSSKTCNPCGYIYQKLNINERAWVCPKCGQNHDRDINAAKNILEQGLNILNDLSGQGMGSDVKQKHGEALGKILEKSKKNTKSINHEATAL